ncbi:uncharacterized protein DEA37_0008322 [Paragonimus westermani]|uniref:Polysaccharide biosynthesis domain-containing protein n=1 Tax=Paragonimus westermani TaxID=34504 RepID=A0A5J4NMU6_9TREM|nr:uncharacterized protein DEA37_0008322 [Paragonimus westermani]
MASTFAVLDYIHVPLRSTTYSVYVRWPHVNKKPNIELQWAIKSYEHAETHFRLLCSVTDLTGLRLTRMDDVIYEEFNNTFPDLDVSVISEEKLKSPESKVIWREFCNKFVDQLEDYNFATLFRLDASKGYDPQNTCIVPRIQFLALEIARNRRGVNRPELLRQLQ